MRKGARKVLQRILQESPTSLRALARKAEVSHVTLQKVRDGEWGLTEDVATRLVRALRGWGTLYSDLADELESAAKEEGRR